jgi:flagellar hook-basal body complex protein FliE
VDPTSSFSALGPLSAYKPAQFVPDIGNDDETPSITPIPATGTATSDPNVTFKDTLMKMLGDVNDKINTSDDNTRDLATGATGDIQKVVTSVEEANLSMQYMMSIRTKLLDAYNEISRLAV